MITSPFEYTVPATLNEALSLVGAGAKPLAGGMSLIPMMKLRFASPEHLVDVGRLPELNYIRESNGSIHIGASTTHYDIETSPLLRGKCPLLPETAEHIGDIQVRNRGTIGGSTAHADPAADYPAALQALEAKIVLKSAKGERTVEVGKFFLDTFTTALKEGELITEVIVPAEPGSAGTSYKKFLQPASGFAIVGIAARINRSGNTLGMVRIGVTGLSGNSYRATRAERALEGRTGTPAEIQAAAGLVADGVDANSDLHASGEYRTSLAAVYAERALASALSRAS
ncbi:MAG TPA: xanthine dehydrogenase family protein subunit M [Bryobacteraceae bacterium]|nr:xanthine dehydrogenase family protein subunit M [Bryobacteraceae bacterium]